MSAVSGIFDLTISDVNVNAVLSLYSINLSDSEADWRLQIIEMKYS
jgi:hypothetical protein